MGKTIIDSLNELVTKLGGDPKDNVMILDALNDISQALGGNADNKMIADALNQIAENYSGGGGGGVEYPLREIAITNSTSDPYNILGINISNNVADYRKMIINANKTTTIKVVATRSVSTGYQEQRFILAVSGDAAEPTLTGDYVTNCGSHVFTETVGVSTIKTRYIVVRIDGKSTKDIAMTIAERGKTWKTQSLMR